ncbi:MAG: nitrous oxide reductase family maturation protein NosD [Bacteroidetes bacterium]|nr:nitrous oxide reductase family maturation protein NosD [Bacteroidota bacterium]MBS1974173.1 nitrous oxide reductase family maturation protein NosD [Bacteroidota bacterium]
MKKILLYALLFCTCFSLYANTIKVGRNENISTIAKGIALAANGDTVLVGPGLYKEHGLIVNKSILLKGANNPVIDGENKFEVVAITVSNVTIEGFTVINSGSSSVEDYAGIKIINSKNVIIRNNILQNNFFGIYSQHGTHCRIENNRISSTAVSEQLSGNGIHCWKSDSMYIIGNKMNGNRDGIYFEFVTNSVISRNESFKNVRYGLHFMFSNNDAYISNLFHNNGSGVAVMYSHGVSMIRNFFFENWGDAAYGLLLKEIADSYIDNNSFEKNTSGIVMEGASRIQVQRNSFNRNGTALRIQASCMDIDIKKNNFIGNTFDVSTNGSLVLNSFKGNFWDKYEGYDLNRDGIGDVPYRPVSLYSMIIEKNPPAMILFRSFMSSLLDKTERVLPGLTPEALKDDNPLMKPLKL